VRQQTAACDHGERGRDPQRRRASSEAADRDGVAGGLAKVIDAVIRP
jgi:hypothetical protein